MSVTQILAKLADPTFLFCELGRGSGKTTHILAPRLDRVQHSMPGSTIVLAAATYKSILDNILPALMEYFHEHYERGIYFEVGHQPPNHFAPCYTFVDSWRHTISFASGTVVQFVSCDRPESMLGKNAAHLFADELLRIPRDRFVERIIPALRSDRSRFGHSPYFMGISAFSSTPNYETDEDWWCAYEADMNTPLINSIQEIAYEIDLRQAALLQAQATLDNQAIRKHQAFIQRWQPRLDNLRRGQTYYLRASSFSNIKILGIDYIRNQCQSIKDQDTLNTSIFAVRKFRAKEMFFGRFGKQHIFDDSYNYTYIDAHAADNQQPHTSRNLRHCDTNTPLIAGYDPGPFSSIVLAQRNQATHTLRAIKTFHVIHPQQHEELAALIDKFFSHHRRRQIFLHYDRAANQRDPRWRDYYPVTGDTNDTDAIMLRDALTRRGWSVTLMSLGAPVVQYAQHYRLLNILFSDSSPQHPHDTILIDANECEDLISSIYHAPLLRTDGRIRLDKSSEKELEYRDQQYYSTQLASAFMYLLWGEYRRLLPESDVPGSAPFAANTFSI